MAKKYQKNVECVGKDISQSLTWLECKKLAQTKKDTTILQELYTWNYARSLA